MLKHGWHLPITNESAPTRRVPHREMLANYQVALDWLSSFFNIASTRFQRYKKDLELFTHWAESTDGSYAELLALFEGREVSSFNSIREAKRLIDICTTLKELDRASIVCRLEKIRSGPELYYKENQENSSNTARDISFELFLAAVLQRRGYPVLLDDRSDITLDYGIGQVYIECKRPHSELESGIERTLPKERDYLAPRIIKKGFSQLRRAIEKSETPAFGILAISLEKIMCPDDFIRFYDDYINAYDVITRGFNNFHVINEKEIYNVPHNDIIGVILFSSEICKIEDEIRFLEDFFLIRLGSDFENGNGILDSLALNLVK